MPNNTYYVFDDKLCKFEGLTKEQIYAAIADATGNTPTGVDDAFITKIKETNRNNALSIWKGTQAQYNAIATKDANTFYIIEDDATISDLQANIDAVDAKVDDLSDFLDHIVIDTRTTVSSWSSISSGEFYTAGYRYKADVTVTGCTSDHTGDVVFSVGTASSGNVAPVFETGANKITIYSKLNSTAYIDRIEVWR